MYGRVTLLYWSLRTYDLWAVKTARKHGMRGIDRSLKFITILYKAAKESIARCESPSPIGR